MNAQPGLFISVDAALSGVQQLVFNGKHEFRNVMIALDALTDIDTTDINTTTADVGTTSRLTASDSTRPMPHSATTCFQ
jgi:hypothetical protein